MDKKEKSERMSEDFELFEGRIAASRCVVIIFWFVRRDQGKGLTLDFEEPFH